MQGVQSLYPINTDFVATKMESVLSDVRINNTKIGIFGETLIIHAVISKLREHTLFPELCSGYCHNRAKIGDALLDNDIINSLCEIFYCH